MMQQESPTLAAHVGSALARRSSEISSTWRRRSRVVGESRGRAAEPAAAEPAAPAPPRRGEPDGGASLVRALSLSLCEGIGWRDDIMRAGWQLGIDAHAREGSLHHLLRAFDTLGDVLLAESEAILAASADGRAIDGIVVARRLGRAVSLLRLAATRGYMQSLGGTLRDRFRTIRHDIRNPLGTIANAVALMSDESLPPETRSSPRVRAMVARNARSIDDLLRINLGDSAASLPALADQPGTLRAVACAVKAELAYEAAQRGVEIVVGDSLPGALIESAAVELVLTSVLLAMLRPERLHDGHPSAELTIELEDADEAAAVVAVGWRAGTTHATPHGDLAFARELSARSGCEVTVGDDGRVLLRAPLASFAPASVEAPASLAGGREERHHVGGPRQRPDLEAGTL
jgi:signal transduction histidine kinase